MQEHSMMIEAQHLGISMLQMFISSTTDPKKTNRVIIFLFHLLDENNITCGTIEITIQWQQQTITCIFSYANVQLQSSYQKAKPQVSLNLSNIILIRSASRMQITAVMTILTQIRGKVQPFYYQPANFKRMASLLLKTNTLHRQLNSKYLAFKKHGGDNQINLTQTVITRTKFQLATTCYRAT